MARNRKEIIESENTKNAEVDKKVSSFALYRGKLVSDTAAYKNRLAIAKLEKLENEVQEKKLANDKVALQLDKERECICYKGVAISQFEGVISIAIDLIRNAPSHLSNVLELTPAQADIVTDYINGILKELSEIDIELDSTSITNAKADKMSALERKQLKGA